MLKNHILKLGEAIKESNSLHAVHLGSNQSSFQAQLYVCSQLGVNLHNNRLQQEFSRKKQTKLPKKIEQKNLSKDKQANIINVEMFKAIQKEKLYVQINEALGTGRGVGDVLTDPLNFSRILDQPEIDRFPETSNSILNSERYRPISDWRISSTQTSNDTCYVCQHHCYVLVFYTRRTRAFCYNKVKPRDLHRRVDKVYFQEAENYPVPLICGSLTNWKTVQTVRVQDYVMAFDTAAKLQMDQLEAQYNKFVSNAT